ncbi:hypothetical protein ACIBTW_20385 [Micromonospora parva]|uniref:hypothetical protein n=1 Tax=Micromonospora parva TaxID=1464048 RepID=UPI0037AEE255
MTHTTLGPHSTTDDVLAGIDLTGTTALVTGGYSGLGLATTRALTQAGARVIVPALRIDADGNSAPGLFKTVEQGAATQVWAATSPQLDANGGGYCVNCHLTDSDPTDSDEAARLWALSADLSGLDLGERA